MSTLTPETLPNSVHCEADPGSDPEPYRYINGSGSMLENDSVSVSHSAPWIRILTRKCSGSRPHQEIIWIRILTGNVLDPDPYREMFWIRILTRKYSGSGSSPRNVLDPDPNQEIWWFRIFTGKCSGSGSSPGNVLDPDPYQEMFWFRILTGKCSESGSISANFTDSDPHRESRIWVNCDRLKLRKYAGSKFNKVRFYIKEGNLICILFFL